MISLLSSPTEGGLAGAAPRQVTPGLCRGPNGNQLFVTCNPNNVTKFTKVIRAVDMYKVYVIMSDHYLICRYRSVQSDSAIYLILITVPRSSALWACI